MTESPFIHLAVRSSYSLLESMITPKGLKAWCVEQGMPAVAITDRNNLYGALEISLTLTDAGIQPIMACCFDVTDGMPKVVSPMIVHGVRGTSFTRTTLAS